MATIPFPETVDEPPYVLLWRIDDVAMPVLFVCIGMLSGHALPFSVVGVVAMFIYRKHRSGHPEFYVLHLLYWFGVYPARGAAFVNPYIREFRP